MGRPKLTTRETKIARRVIDRKILLKKAAIVGYKRPEGFGHFNDDVVVEQKLEIAVEVKVENTEEENTVVEIPE